MTFDYWAVIRRNGCIVADTRTTHTCTCANKFVLRIFAMHFFLYCECELSASARACDPLSSSTNEAKRRRNVTLCANRVECSRRLATCIRHTHTRTHNCGLCINIVTCRLSQLEMGDKRNSLANINKSPKCARNYEEERTRLRASARKMVRLHIVT